MNEAHVLAALPVAGAGVEACAGHLIPRERLEQMQARGLGLARGLENSRAAQRGRHTRAVSLSSAAGASPVRVASARGRPSCRELF